MSCEKLTPDVAGTWKTSVKFKTEIPGDMNDMTSASVGHFYTVQSSEYVFSNTDDTYKATVKTQYDSCEFLLGTPPEGFNVDDLPAALNHTAKIEGTYHVGNGSIELAPYSISFDDSDETIDFEEYAAQAPTAAAYAGTMPLSANEDGTISIGNIKFTRQD